MSDEAVSDIAAIDRRRKEWIAAVTGRDVDRYLDILTDDIVWVPPGQAALVGRNAFASWVRPFFEQFSYDMEISEPTVRIAGGWAVEEGIFRTTMRSLADGQAYQHAAHYLVLWRRDETGTWRIERYVDRGAAS